VEGPTNDPQVNALRDRQRRNFLVTLFLSQGVPMLCGGDEWGRTQDGNNNARPRIVGTCVNCKIRAHTFIHTSEG